jgi:predicted ATP-grasp superfamily ATP-dependent carboligase
VWYVWYPKGVVNPRTTACFSYVARKGQPTRRRWGIKLCMECAMKVITGKDISFMYYGKKYNLIGNKIEKEK